MANNVAPLATIVASDEDSLTAVDDAVASAIADLPSPESQRSYECVWRFYTHWLSEQRIDVRAVRPKHVQSYIGRLRDEGKAKGTVSRALTVIRSLYASIVTHELMPTNPARAVKGFQESDRFRANAEYRGIPFAKVGMRVRFDNGDLGTIVGHNDSANLDVILDGDDEPLNCHPAWQISYLVDGEWKRSTLAGTR